VPTITPSTLFLLAFDPEPRTLLLRGLSVASGAKRHPLLAEIALRGSAGPTRNVASSYDAQGVADFRPRESHCYRSSRQEVGKIVERSCSGSEERDQDDKQERYPDHRVESHF
jgi:hypothetical protein